MRVKFGLIGWLVAVVCGGGIAYLSYWMFTRDSLAMWISGFAVIWFGLIVVVVLAGYSTVIVRLPQVLVAGERTGSHTISTVTAKKTLIGYCPVVTFHSQQRRRTARMVGFWLPSQAMADMVVCWLKDVAVTNPDVEGSGHDSEDRQVPDTAAKAIKPRRAL